MNQALVAALSSLAGVGLGTVLSSAREIIFEKRARNRAAQYLAIRVVCVLDKYIEGCEAVAMDDGSSPYNDQESQPQTSQPPAPEFPNDLDWKSIDSRLAYSLLSLANEAARADARIDQVWEFSSPPYNDVIEERSYQYAKLGLEAASMASTLRVRYELPAIEYGERDPVERMAKVKNDIDDQRAVEAAQFQAYPFPPVPRSTEEGSSAA